ncbi:hypothetical protein KEC56_04690 [Microbacterium sp. YMB-B2]|uniref:Uncharacterized protein n=1 Tax=Microbacterium tenebrionis TaxID=2830665 RepID=A0A9X1LN61_9MICO|nr:hypothetical protein [Microbacterium tenebrionis]MCC2028819.1 hypothetical protein [Microbacterium tenebrionis]
MALLGRLTPVLVTVVSLIGVVSGYSGPTRRFEFEERPQPGYEEFIREELGLGSWSCTYSPTYDNEWYDDVLCSNGSDSHRPFPQAMDNFVEEGELVDSAAEYEAELNAGG